MRASSTWAKEPKRKNSLVLNRLPDGSYGLEIYLNNLRLRRVAGTNKYMLASLSGRVPVSIDVDGVLVKPNVVLKVYRKLSAREVRKREISRKFPIILSDNPTLL